MTKQTGIEFVHTHGGTGQRYVIESLPAGCAILDYDGDGWKDIYLLNGCPLPADPKQAAGSATGIKPTRPTNALYRNLGNWRFEDVTLRAGAAEVGYGMGAAVADYDNDGDSDIYISNYGPNVLLKNNGDGTFSDATEEANVSGGERFGAGVAFFDMDGDGDLDLYAANYQKFKLSQHKKRMIGEYQFHPGPIDYPPDNDMLFRNEGDGSFSDITAQAGIDVVSGTGMGVIASDTDDDGDIDIFVVNDGFPNFLFVNDGQGKFSEEAVLAGLAVDRTGRANGNMGVDIGDADGDGQLDIFTTSFQDEMPVLYRNLGWGLFDDITNVSGIPRSLFNHVNWGTGFADFDNDADQDIYIACGHFMDNIAFIDDRTTMKVRNYLLLNNGKGHFDDVSQKAGSGLAIVESSRGVAIDDLDNDGDLDIVVLNYNSVPSILRNDTVRSNRWLDVRLIGTQCNRSAVGARAFVVSSGRTQVAERYSGRGYQSSFGSTLHFGLSEAAADKNSSEPIIVRVRWPKTASQQIAKITTHHVDGVNQSLILLEPPD